MKKKEKRSKQENEFICYGTMTRLETVLGVDELGYAVNFTLDNGGDATPFQCYVPILRDGYSVKNALKSIMKAFAEGYVVAAYANSEDHNLLLTTVEGETLVLIRGDWMVVQ